MNRQQIKNIVDVILGENHLREFPVNLNKIAKSIDAHVEIAQLKDGLSGFAFQQNGTKFIGISSTDGALRQRFTFAHELGHIFLHKNDAVNYDTGLMMMRDDRSTNGSDEKEIEANRFAAELLMPEDEVRKDMSKAEDIDFLHDNESTRLFIKKLAEKYGVSSKAMNVRISALYFN